MKESPMLFQGWKVRAIYNGATQTRRVIRSQPFSAHTIPYLNRNKLWVWRRDGDEEDPAWPGIRCPYGQSGSILWVRETWFNPDYQAYGTRNGPTYYRATDDPDEWPWRPSIHMPRWASRLTLRLTDVRVQRVQEITDGDVAAEGVDWGSTQIGSRWGSPARDAFAHAWDAINGKRGYSWDSNPWVWALTFAIERTGVGR